MPTPILMPALSPTMEEGTLAKWKVKEGDKVSSGDVIAEIETDKATMEVEAVDEGVVGKIVIPAGTENVKVNATIAILLGDGESAADIGKSAAKTNGSAPPLSRSAGEGPGVREMRRRPLIWRSPHPLPLSRRRERGTGRRAASTLRRLQSASQKIQGSICRRSPARVRMGAL